ncbi:MAG: sulfotransferase domain-containing protein [Caldilineaceae bacterium]|nr:sulfotransferase domain-containing protein [Caldilineaceae bacterium]
MVGYLLLLLVYLSVALVIPVMGLFAWQYLNTRGTAYFGRPQAEREQFKRQLARFSRWIVPLVRPLGRRVSTPNRFAFAYAGIYAPANSCSRQTFNVAVHYKPQANDLFVVTQMKCGTTWMQQIVYEILCRGEGNLGDNGHVHLYAMSSWLESFNSVSLADAPLVGAQQQRIIKSHLPASLCPYSEVARYIYVTRHPVSCFQSCSDFFAALAGPFTPSADALLAWYCSDEMWWGSWPDHVAGFWQWAQTRPNVLFVHFETMKTDLPAVLRTVAAFIGSDLTESELQRVAEKCSFDYMKTHESQFEMIPPNFFSTNESFFKSGSADRHRSVDITAKAKITSFCRTRLATETYPLETMYPDLM